MQTREVTAEDFYGPGYDDCDERIPDIDKAQRLLGWTPRTPLAEMLPPIVADYRARYGPRSPPPPPGRRWAGGGGSGGVSLHVVVPAYNAARHLPGVIDRLVRAAPPELGGIIVVDDGSRDDTAEVAARLAAAEPRLTPDAAAAATGATAPP